MKPRRTLPTHRLFRPLWWRIGREIARRIAVAWHLWRWRANFEEVVGYRLARRINGTPIGKEYMHNCRIQRKELRDKIAAWNR